MLELALIVLVGIYLQVICSRNKKHWKSLQEHTKALKAVERRRIKNEQLKAKRIKHPKVVYIQDYFPPSPTQRII